MPFGLLVRRGRTIRTRGTCRVGRRGRRYGCRTGRPLLPVGGDRWRRGRDCCRGLSSAVLGRQWPFGLIVSSVARVYHVGPSPQRTCVEHGAWISAVGRGRTHDVVGRLTVVPGDLHDLPPGVHVAEPIDGLPGSGELIHRYGRFLLTIRAWPSAYGASRGSTPRSVRHGGVRVD